MEDEHIQSLPLLRTLCKLVVPIYRNPRSFPVESQTYIISGLLKLLKFSSFLCFSYTNKKAIVNILPIWFIVLKS